MRFKQKEELKCTLADIAKKYVGFRIGIVGSFARDKNTPKSDVDIVLDKKGGGIGERDIGQLLEIEESIKSLSDNEWDILWLSTLRDEQNSYLETMKAFDLEVSIEECIYDNILKDVIWIE